MKYLKTFWPLLLLLLPSVSVKAAEGALDSAIVVQVMDMYGLDSGSYEIEVLSNPLKSESIDDATLEIKPLTMKDPLGLYTVLATVRRGEEEERTGQVRMRVSKFAEVLVAADKIQRLEDFTADRVKVARMDVTNLREQALTSLEETAGYRSKRNIAKGSIITTGAMEPVPAVDAGGETLIVYNDGLCRITAPGLALQSGVTGDFIKVKNKASNKIIMAKVQGDGSVSVE